MTYLFETVATMKPYNNKKWWIDSKIIQNFSVDAENLEAAIVAYAEIVSDKYGVEISKNALKNKQPMYIDTKSGIAKQAGYVITSKTDFRDDERYTWSTQYIDLWVNISIIIDAFPEEGEA